MFTYIYHIGRRSKIFHVSNFYFLSGNLVTNGSVVSDGNNV